MDNTDGQNLKRLKIALIFLVIVLIALTAFHVLALRRFRVVSTDPNISRISNVTSNLEVTFNKSVAKKGLKLTSNPNIISSYTVRNKVLSISLNSITASEAYVITIKSATAIDNETIKNKAIHFVAQYVNTDSLPEAQQQAILRKQENYSSPANNPIVTHLPYQTLNFSLAAKIVSGPTKPVLTLQAVLYLSQADMFNETVVVAQDKQMVLNYIQSLGLNPSSYTIEYSISAP